MEQLILENQNLIYSITKYFPNQNKEDLFQAGCIGMIYAYKNYNKNMNVKFTTYAYPYILGEMKKLVREDKPIKISRNIQLLNLKIEKVSILLSQKLMREPTNKEISDYLLVPEYLINEAIDSRKTILSIDEPINGEDNSLNLHEVISKTDNLNYNDLISLKSALNTLDEIDKKLILKRYMNDLSQQETANELGMSQVQVSRKETKVLKKLRTKLCT